MCFSNDIGHDDMGILILRLILNHGLKAIIQDHQIRQAQDRLLQDTISDEIFNGVSHNISNI
jgi:hypothetical protein